MRLSEIYHVPGYTKPVLLLDVDGVLNASIPGWGQIEQGVAMAAGHPFKIRWAPALVDKIKKLHASGRIEIRWCTTWCDYISSIEKLLGLPQFKCESIPPQGITQQAKINAAIGVIEERRPLIWIDDNAIPVRGAAGWDSRLKFPTAGRLYVVPNPVNGIQPAHIEKIERYLALIEGVHSDVD